MLRVALVALLLLVGACTTTSNRPSDAQLAKAAEYNAQLGNGYLARGDLEQAKAKFEKALRQDEDNPNANSGYALLQARLGNNALAVRHFEKALEIDGQNSQVLNNYGVYLCDQGQRRKAEGYFERAAANALYKTPEYAYRNAATCALSDGDLEGAEKFYKQALVVNSRFGPVILDMARLNLRRQRNDTALGYLDRYHKLYPQAPESLLLGVHIHRALGDRNQELDYASRLSSLFPRSPQAQHLNETSTQ